MPAVSPHSHSRFRAFTLLEIMIVVGMAALVLAISIPFVQRTIRRDAVYQAVHVVEDACHNARATAIFNNGPVDLVIRPQDKVFRVVASAVRTPAPVLSKKANPVEGDPDAPAPVRDFARHAPKPFQGSLGDDVTFDFMDVNFTSVLSEEEARVRFHPNGTSDEFTVVLRIGATAWRKISLDVVTGLPTLEVIR